METKRSVWRGEGLSARRFFRGVLTAALGMVCLGVSACGPRASTPPVTTDLGNEDAGTTLDEIGRASCRERG